MKAKNIIFYGLIAAMLALALTGCDNGTGGGTNPTHTHTYADTWSKDATQHWKECTANDGAKAEVGNHTGDPCTVCGYTDPDQPKDQSATISNLFGKGFNVTVSGESFTNAEWGSGSTGVVGRIEAALQARYDGLGETAGDVLFTPAFSQTGGVIIIVERNPSYANYSATYNGNTIRINFAIVGDSSALNLALFQGTRVLTGIQSVPEQG